MTSVSVIVPNFNHGQFLTQRIESILNQTFQDFELILLDDASSDNSKDIIELYRRNAHVSHIVYNKENGGTPFKQWDKGIELAKGEWIWIAESDDFADELFLETLISNVRRYPNVGFAFSGTFFVNENGSIIGQSNEYGSLGLNHIVHSSNIFIKKRLFIRNTIDNVSECIFKKKLYSSGNKYLYEKMRLCGDWFFYVLLSKQTDVLEVFTPLSFYRKHTFNTVISTEHEGRTFTEGISIYKYLTQTTLQATCKDYQEIAKYWLQNKSLYNYSSETNRVIKRLFLKDYPLVVMYYHLISLYRLVKESLMIYGVK